VDAQPGSARWVAQTGTADQSAITQPLEPDGAGVLPICAYRTETFTTRLTIVLPWVVTGRNGSLLGYV
jgi:hypothetical protein